MMLMLEVAGGILIAAAVLPSIIFIFDQTGTRAAERRFQKDLDSYNASSPGLEDEMDQLLKPPAKQLD